MEATPCTHRFGAEATFSHVGDFFWNVAPGFPGHGPEALAFQYNMGLTCFDEGDDVVGVVDLSVAQRRAIYETRRVVGGLYYHGYESHTPDWCAAAFEARYGYWPAALAYGYGQNQWADMAAAYVFGGRNSAVAAGSPYGNFVTGRYHDRPSSSRFADFGYSTAEIAAAVNAGGWYVDFAHWHYLTGGVADLDGFLSDVRAAISSTGRNVACIAFPDAATHAALRDHATCALTEESLAVAWTPFPVELARTVAIPLSVLVDFTGSAWEGLRVDTDDADMVWLGGDRYIVEVPYALAGATITWRAHSWYEDYATFEPPTILALERVGANLTISTDIPCRVAVFSGTGPAANTVTAPVRSNVFGTSHTVAVGATPDAELWAGVMSTHGASQLRQVSLGDQSVGIDIDVLLGEPWDIDLRLTRNAAPAPAPSADGANATAWDLVNDPTGRGGSAESVHDEFRRRISALEEQAGA